MAGKYSVEAVFGATDKMTGPLGRMERRMSRFVASASKGLESYDRKLQKISGAFSKVGAVAVAGGTAAGFAMANVVRTGADFEQTLTNAAAKFPGEIRRGTKAFAELEKAAADIGATTEFTASQSAEALNFLAMAGFDARGAMAALPGVVDLATAAQTDLATATDISTDAVGAFGLATKDAAQLSQNLARVNDVLAKTSNSANTTIEQMYEAIVAGAPSAVSAGVSVETYAALVGKLADAGEKGSSAGTSLKNVFARLTDPKIAKDLRKMGVETRTSSGDLRDAIDIFGDLGVALDGLGTADKSGALNRIFGRIPLAAVNILLAQGADNLRAYRAQIEGASGATARMASVMRDTTTGEMNTFISAWEGMKIEIFGVVKGPLREAVAGMTDWVRANSGLIAQRVGDTIGWIRDNLEDIVTWGKRVAIVATSFYAVSTAVKVAAVSVEAFGLASSVVTGVGKAIAFASAQVGLYNIAAAKGEFGAGMGGMGMGGQAGVRAGLNMSKFGLAVNSVTSTMGKAGLLGAALGVGVAIGTWLNHQFGISDWLSSVLADLRGINDEINKAGGRTDKRGDTSGNRHYADGTVTDASGRILKAGPAAGVIEARHSARRFNDLVGADRLNQPGMSIAPEAASDAAAVASRWGRGSEDAPFVPSAFTPAERTVTMVERMQSSEQVELIIKDESRRAELAQEAKSKRIGIQIQKSGVF